MQLTWDSSEQQVRLADGRLSGYLTSEADYEVDLEDVADVTLQEWLAFSLQTEVKGTDHKLSWNVLEGTHDGPFSFVIIDPRPDGRLKVHLDTEGPAWAEDMVESVVRQLCTANGDVLDRTNYSDGIWVFEVYCQPDDRTTRQIFALQAALRRMFRLPDQIRPTGDLEADGAYQLVKVGGAEALLGVSESEWLEVKSRGYNLDDFANRVELAQDVARFANGAVPALLMIGFRTRRRNGVDVIDRVVPLEIAGNALVRYHDAIDRLVYPTVEGLTIDAVPYKGGSIVAICIPAQAESRKPYLVHGAVVAGRNEGAFISIIQRRAEGSIPMSIVEVHALLAAGRSVLRGSR